MPITEDDKCPSQGRNEDVQGGHTITIDIKTEPKEPPDNDSNQLEKTPNCPDLTSSFGCHFEFVYGFSASYAECEVKDEPASPINSSDFVGESQHSTNDKIQHTSKTLKTVQINSETHRKIPEYCHRKELNPRRRVHTKHIKTSLDEANAFGNLLCRNKVLICDICGYNKGSRWRMMQHMTTVHNYKEPVLDPEHMLRCHLCPKTFDHRFKLRKHIKRHTAQHVCGYCGKIFTDTSSLTVHTRMHTGNGGPSAFGNLLCRNKELICDICGHKIKARWRMMQHMASVHKFENPQPETVYRCHLCPKTFDHRYNLQSHVKRHTSKYSCEYCGKLVSDMGNLRVHIRTHTGDRPYHCSECGKMFATSSALSLHVKDHLGEKPYKCDECEKMFTNLKSLQSHKTGHSSEKPYVCEVCGKAFSRQPALKLHMNTHTGHTPYKCMICERLFRSPGARRSHEKNAHKSRDT